MSKILYITGSFPRLGDGIGDGAGKLYDAIEDKSQIELVTSDFESIRAYVDECGYRNVQYVTNWKIKTAKKLLDRIRKERIRKVLIEYAGNGYKKDFGISLLPLFIRIQNKMIKGETICHLRLHEYSMCRPARKLFTLPLVWFSHCIDTPSYVEYKLLSKKYHKPIIKTHNGTSFTWRNGKRTIPIHKGDKIVLAFFGGIYPGKGIETLLDIWEELESLYPNKYEYQLLGGFPKGLTDAFDDYQKKITNMINDKGLQDKLTISGYLPADEIERRLDCVDIAVLPYEDGLTLRRGSFVAFLGRHVAIVTSEGDEEATKLFDKTIGVKMCKDSKAMIQGIIDYSLNNGFIEAGEDNDKFRAIFEWKAAAQKVLESF